MVMPDVDNDDNSDSDNYCGLVSACCNSGSSVGGAADDDGDGGGYRTVVLLLAPLVGMMKIVGACFIPSTYKAIYVQCCY